MEDKVEQFVTDTETLRQTRRTLGDSGPLHTRQSDRQRLIDQQLDHARAWMENQTRQPRDIGSHTDIEDSLPDAFSIRAGLPVRNPHPLAQWSSELSLPRLCEQLQIRRLTSSDFGSALSLGFRSIATSAYSLEDDCGPCFDDVVVGDFRPAAFPVLDTIDLQQVADSGTGGVGGIQLQTISTAVGESGHVLPYRARVMISRQLLLNDDFLLISSLIQHLSAHAARLSGQRLGSILDANANLSDGAALMSSINTTSTAGFSVNALAEAAGKLRMMASSTGNTLNLKASVWLVPPAGEIIARYTVQLVGVDITVVCCPWIPVTHSYLLCSPKQQPVFKRLMLDAPPLRPSVSTVNLPLQFDGIALDVEISFGIQAVSRLGIVRIPTS